MNCLEGRHANNKYQTTRSEKCGEACATRNGGDFVIYFVFYWASVCVCVPVFWFLSHTNKKEVGRRKFAVDEIWTLLCLCEWAVSLPSFLCCFFAFSGWLDSGYRASNQNEYKWLLIIKYHSTIAGYDEVNHRQVLSFQHLFYASVFVWIHCNALRFGGGVYVCVWCVLFGLRRKCTTKAYHYAMFASPVVIRPACQCICVWLCAQCGPSDRATERQIVDAVKDKEIGLSVSGWGIACLRWRLELTLSTNKTELPSGKIIWDRRNCLVATLAANNALLDLLPLKSSNLQLGMFLLVVLYVYQRRKSCV